MKGAGDAGGEKNGRWTPEIVSVTLLEGMCYAGDAGGHRVDLDAPAGYGGGEEGG